jgi:hypothetical protein
MSSEKPAVISARWTSRRRRVVAAALALTVVAAGCADMEGDEASDAGESTGAAEASSERDAPAVAGGDLYLDTDELDTAGSTVVPPAGDLSTGVLQAAPTAGSVDDNALWDDYLLYRDGYLGSGLPYSPIDVSGRQLLTVVDAQGDPVLGATITVVDPAGTEVAHLRTYADGRAVFLAPTAVDPATQARPAYTARVARGPVTAEVPLEPGAISQSLTLDADLPSPAQVDVMFLIDTTGSMSDEIERLKASMISVSEQLGQLPAAPDVRFSMVLYRDRGDEYVTRTFDFTPDVFSFTDALQGVVADGGGDTPESLDAALHDALAGPSWRPEGTVKLVFLLSDAAPHLPTEPGYGDEPDYAVDVREAAAQGIKIFPIASSGLDDQGEFVFRQLAQVTMGRFVFLTYGADGRSPGDSTSHHVDPADYDVLALDQLVVQLVTDEVAHLQ